MADRLTRAGTTVAHSTRTAPPSGRATELFVRAGAGTPAGVEAVTRHVHDRLGGVGVLVRTVGADGRQHLPLPEQTDDVRRPVRGVDVSDHASAIVGAEPSSTAAANPPYDPPKRSGEQA
ncbi:MAG TPA: hypothetical protein VE546_05105 [Streptomyces sp.]|uniref:hypothetical protein n=1 Tax=Streptomyces sp. TaxID=1931 RepID=UPI002D4DE1C1|nr:hypothetical protein [Streptomyces sp.]HZG02941.1 hypothetical protein [Streptomyces sp.]